MTSVKVKSKKQKPINHSIGNYYQEYGTKEMFVLAQTCPGKVSLISVKSGNRYEEAVTVGNAFNISNDEMKEICQYEEFKLIESITITED